MEGNFQQTSFIPKKPIVDPTVREPKKMSFFSLVMFVVFFTVLLIAIGVFAYQMYVKKSIDDTKTALNAELAKFEPSLVAELSRLDQKIEAAKLLLNQHISLSTFFEFLGQHTLRNVRFSSFSYAAAPNGASIAMNGQAKGFSEVALQSDEFLKPEVRSRLSQSAFADPNLDQKGNVNFNFRGMIAQGAFLYRDTVRSGNVVTRTASSTATSTNSTP